MKNFSLVIEYDGRGFLGWQRQAEGAGATVQGVLEKALGQICDHPVVLHGSGRTDTGVHARGQTASFTTSSSRSPSQIMAGGNCLLPPQVAIISATEVSPDFHARFKATGKTYEYDFLLSPTRRPLYQGRAWWVGPKLNWEAVQEALPALVGEHDFAAFQSAGSEVKSTVRSIYQAEMSRIEPDLIRLSITGSGFLRHMVRAIAGLLVEIARGRLKATSLPKIIASQDRTQAGPTAPPDGLYLSQVFYHGLNQ